MPTSLSPTTIDLVKGTVPALDAYGVAITERMYERLFQDEAIRDLFNRSHNGAGGSQPKALAAAVAAYARNIDNLGVLAAAVERIAQKHVSLNILREHYPYVASALLAAMKDVLGDAATDDVLAAWGEAYWFLAELLIGREATLYRDLAAEPGGWNGWRDFAVETVVDECSIIRSFTLVPADGGKVARHKPGQYLGLALDLPKVGKMRRNYSISCAPNDRAYRITVKREANPGVPPGQASNWLHDHGVPGAVLRLAAPAGDFFLDTTAGTPVVLVSGGVGLTPMVSMLETIAEVSPDRPTFWVHGALNSRVQAMRRHVSDLAARTPGLRLATFYSNPMASDRQGADYDARGLISAEWLVRSTPADAATFYLCGPTPFLRSLVNGLARWGVGAERIRYEFFGPADDLLEPETPKLVA